MIESTGNNVEKFVKDINEFIHLVSNKKLDKPEHLSVVSNELNKILNNGKSLKLAFSVPPRHGKSYTLLHFIALYLLRHPHKKIAYVTYEQGFSEQQTQIAYQIMRAAGIKESGHTVNRKYWLLRQGGGLKTASVQGPLTGQGFDLVIIDDPFKDNVEATSLRIRERIWMWFNNVANTRLEPNGSMVVVHTRWHPDDLIGRIIEQMPDEYTYIRIPAIADGLDNLGKLPAKDPAGRNIGEPLWEKRFDLKQLEKVKKYNPYGFSALYQGLPIAKEGRVFKGVYFYTKKPDTMQVAAGVDLAYSKNTKSDFSACVVLGRSGENIYVLHVERWQNDITYTKAKLKQMQERFGVIFRIEANGPQKAIYDELLHSGINVNKVDVTQDKYTRSQSFAGAWNAGEVLLPEKADWLKEYIDEVSQFTGVNDKNDDMIDATVHAYEDLKFEFKNIWF